MKIFLALFFASSLYCAASLPATYDELVKIYGNPSKFNPATNSTQWTQNDMTITIGGTPYLHKFKFIEITRETSFNELEIADILKPYSPDVDWVQQGSSDWVLTQVGAIAHWDGAGKITLTSLGK